MTLVSGTRLGPYEITGSMPFVPQYLFFTALHDEPRFQAIVDRLGIPKRAV